MSSAATPRPLPSVPAEWGAVYWPQRNLMCVDPAKVPAETQAAWNALPEASIKWRLLHVNLAMRVPWGTDTAWCITAVKPTL